MVLGVLVAGWSLPAGAEASQSEMVTVPSGGYSPFISRDKKQSLLIPAFRMDRFVVTNRLFLDFVTTHPEWRKSNIKAVFADSHYLDNWSGDLSWGSDNLASQPVTRISWFAAQAYCSALGKSLPTTDQWEYALADAGRSKAQVDAKVLEWYGRPNSQSLPTIEQSDRNGFGINGLVGLVWEWTLDFNSVMSAGELRQSGKDKDLFCGGSSLDARNAADYAAFMRFSMRASLKATYTTPNLGFRCAKERL